jgi:hypothetical protein
MFPLRFQRRYLQRGSLRVISTPSQRCISYSPVLWDPINATTTSTELKAATETQDIKTLDALLKVVS